MFEGCEDFSDEQVQLLEHYVTNVDSNVFALRNLPEVLKGALFSRYSRSSLGLRSLLLKEFINNDDETGFEAIVGQRAYSDKSEDQMLAIKRAQNFYDRILDGYGDDSIGELGGAHLAVENISMLAAKVLEDSRLGGSPLEKSTRYIYFDQKVNDQYMFYREPVLMTSAYRDLYEQTCNKLFQVYGELVPPLTEKIKEEFPKDPDISKIAYGAALRAKVLDCLRGLLPASTLTNMGIYGNGRFYEQLIHKLIEHNYVELQDIGRKSFDELSKVIPSFIRRSESTHRHHQDYAEFYSGMDADRKLVVSLPDEALEPNKGFSVKLVSSQEDAVERLMAALLFSYTDCSLEDLQAHCKNFSEEQVAQLLDSACSRRENRRHKSPRALEHVFYTFEIVADFGIYRDLQRHRILTQERQLLTCDHGFYLPDDFKGTEMEGIYLKALEEGKAAFDTMREEFPEEAQYVVPMAYNIRWYFHVNLRALQWLCELRSSAAGHPGYRYVAQEMARQVSSVHPEFERFFKFVDYNGYELGRLGQEQRKANKLKLAGDIEGHAGSD